MGKDAFVIYKSFYKPISSLSDKQLGRLFRCIFLHQLGEVAPVEDDIRMAFEFFKNQFELDESKYQGIVRRNQENGRKGGAPKGNKNAENKQPKQPTGLKTTQTPQNKHNDKDKDKDLKERESSIDNSLKKNLDDEFEKFWELYDKKRGDKTKVKNIFNKLAREEKDRIFETLPAYIASTPDKKFRKDPLTYLNNKSWNDEIINSNGEKQRESPAYRQPADNSKFRDSSRVYSDESDF